MTSRGRGVREGFELLDDGSSGSEQEHFSMSPLGNNNKKLDKSRERHGWSQRKSKSEKCCSLPLSLLFLLVVMLCACLGVLTVYVYNLHNKIGVLEARLDTLMLDSASPDVQMNQPQGLAQVTKEQEQLEKEIGDLKKTDVAGIQQNISTLFIQMKALNVSLNKIHSDKLTTGENSPPDYSSIAKNVANFGSKLESLQGNVKDLTAQQETISAQSQKIEMIDGLITDIDSVNFTMLSHFHEHMHQINILRNRTASLDLRLSLDTAKPSAQLPNIESLVQNAIHSSLQDMQNVTQTQLDANTASLVALDVVTGSLQEQVESINETLTIVKSEMHNSGTEEVQKQNTALPDPKIAAMLGDYGQFRNKTIRELKDLQSDFDSLDDRLQDVEHTIQNLPVTQSDLFKEFTDESQLGTTHTKSDILSAEDTRGETITTTQSIDDYLHKEGMTKREDLVGQFIFWDTDNDDNKLSLEELNAAMDPETVSQDEFDRFDRDNDEKLDEEELIAAFGFFDDSAENGGDEGTHERAIKKKDLEFV